MLLRILLHESCTSKGKVDTVPPEVQRIGQRKVYRNIGDDQRRPFMTISRLAQILHCG